MVQCSENYFKDRDLTSPRKGEFDITDFSPEPQNEVLHV